MKIESPKISVSKSDKDLFDFLTNVENFEKLMPQNIAKFEMLSEKRFIFALSGMPEITLELKDQTPFSKVVLGAASSKLPAFTLTALISNTGDSTSEAQLVFEGEFNAMMGMMIKGPITNFVNTLAENLKKI